jgi:hypothetical protein
MSSPSWPGISQCFSDTSKVTAAVKSLWYPLKMYIVMIYCSFVDQEKQIITGTFCTPSVGGAIESVLCSAFAHPKSHQNVSRAQDSSGNKARGVSDPAMKFSRSLKANSNYSARLENCYAKAGI